jgi:hypothetical protein
MKFFPLGYVAEHFPFNGIIEVMNAVIIMGEGFSDKLYVFFFLMTALMMERTKYLHKKEPGELMEEFCRRLDNIGFDIEHNQLSLLTSYTYEDIYPYTNSVMKSEISLTYCRSKAGPVREHPRGVVVINETPIDSTIVRDPNYHGSQGLLRDVTDLIKYNISLMLKPEPELIEPSIESVQVTPPQQQSGKTLVDVPFDQLEALLKNPQQEDVKPCPGQDRGLDTLINTLHANNSSADSEPLNGGEHPPVPSNIPSDRYTDSNSNHFQYPSEEVEEIITTSQNPQGKPQSPSKGKKPKSNLTKLLESIGKQKKDSQKGKKIHNPLSQEMKHEGTKKPCPDTGQLPRPTAGNKNLEPSVPPPRKSRFSGVSSRQHPESLRQQARLIAKSISRLKDS